MEAILSIHTSNTPTRDAHRALPASNFLPYALNPLREAQTELEYIIAKGDDHAIETRCPFIIDRCEYVIGRMREAMSRANGDAYLAAKAAGGAA